MAEPTEPEQSQTDQPDPPLEGRDLRLFRERKAKERAEAIRKKRIAQLKKGTETIRLKKRQRDLVREKVEKGLPITEQEREMLQWTAGKTRVQKKKEIIDAAAALVIKPQTVNELRIVVQQTAARYAYNPIEELIKLSSPESELKDSDRVAIHKALLPFLAPTIPSVKAQALEQEEKGKIKVTISQFVFPEKQGMSPLHKERPKSEVSEVIPPEAEGTQDDGSDATGE